MTVMDQGLGAPEAPAAQEPVVAVPEPSTSSETQEGNASPSPAKQDIPDAVKQRLATLARHESKWRREAAESKARAEFLERQYAQPQNGQQPQQQRAEPQVDPNQVYETARQQAAFDLKCNEVATKGKAVPGFEAALSNLGMIGLSTDALGILIESDDAPKLIAHLGQHLDEAAEIFAKPPGAMGRALAKLEHQLTSQPAVSSAAVPLKPLGGNGGAGNGPAIGTKAWFEAENKRDAERRRR